MASLIYRKYEPNIAYYRDFEGWHVFESDNPFKAYSVHEGILWLRCEDHERYIGPCKHVVIPDSYEYAVKAKKEFEKGEL